MSEAIYAGIRSRSVLQNQLKPAPAVSETLTVTSFLQFYVPLVLTTLIQIAVQPIVAAALSRLPDPLLSLAVWPVIYGMLIVLTSAGYAFIEAVVVLLDEPRSLDSLYRFTIRLGLALTGLLLLMNSTPLAELWFRRVAALPEHLVEVARQSLWLISLLPGLVAIDSWFQGLLMNQRRTRGITESVLVSLVATLLILGGGLVWGQVSGLSITMVAMMIGAIVRTSWLWYCTRPAIQEIRLRENQQFQQTAPIAS